MATQRFKKAALNFAKILLSLVLLYFVFTKIPFAEVAAVWKTVRISYLIAAAALFLLSQIISAKRLQIFFETYGFPISYDSNFKLYLLGMFYNFFIPGGIGGDAYKVYILNRRFGWEVKKLTSLLFNDRLSGLIAIMLIIGLLAMAGPFGLQLVLPFIFVAGIFAGFFLVKKLFPIFKTIYFKALLYSGAVQLLQIACFFLLLKSIGVQGSFLTYAFLFLASSVLSLISFAGLGVRELLFLQDGKYFEFSPQYSVSASLLFTVITAFFSFCGLYFQIRKLNLKLSQ